MLLQAKQFRNDYNICFASTLFGAFTMNDFSTNLNCYIWRIKNLRDKLVSDSFALQSEVFEVNKYNFLFIAKLQVKNDGYAYMSLGFRDPDDDRKVQNVKIYPKVTYVLRGTVGSKQCPDVIRSQHHPFNEPTENFNFERLLISKKSLSQPEYSPNDVTELIIHVESPSLAQQVFSYDGQLRWKVSNYSKKKCQNLPQLQSSPYFYTCRQGFRVQAKLCFYHYKDRRGVELTAEINFLTGKFDSLNTGSFPHATTVTLINHLNSAKNVVRSVEHDLKSWKSYCVALCSMECLENDGFIQNDTLHYQVRVEGRGSHSKFPDSIQTCICLH